MADIRQAIEFAKQNPDTPFAVELRRRIESGQMNTELKEAGIQSPVKEKGFVADIKGIGTGIAEDIKKRGANVAESFSAMQNGEQGFVRSALQTAGQGAGAISDVIGNVFTGGVKAISPQPVQEAVGGAIQSGVQSAIQTEPAQKLMDWYSKLDEKTKRDIGSAAGIVSLATDVAGAGLAKKPTQQAIKKGVKVAEDVTSAGKKAVQSATGVVGDIAPTRAGLVNTELTKALDLTQGDVKNIYSSTGNEAGDFIAKNNLIGNTVEETKSNLNDLFKTNYDLVRNEISNVPTVYKKTAVPRYEDALTQIKKVTQDVVGLEDVNKEIDTLLKKETVSLNDAQRVKELMDEHFNLYKVTGDAQAGATKEGLVNLRKDIQSFIEKEVKNNSGVDIKPLNNNVATSKTILNAIDDRITRGATRATVTAGDVVTFLTGSGFGTPLGGVVAVLGKKLYQSPSFKLRFTKWLNKKTPEQLSKITEQLQKGVIPKEIKVIEKKK